MADQPGPRRAFGRSLSDFTPLSEAEQRLVEACRTGQVAEFGDGTRPGPLALLIKLPAGRTPADVLGAFPALHNAPERYMRWRLLPRAKSATADGPRIWLRFVPLADALMLPADLPAQLAVPLRWLRPWPTSNWWGHRIALWWPGADIPHANLHDWLMSIRVRAGLIRFLLLGGDAQAPVHEQGVLMARAWIAGPLDLTACPNVFPFWAFSTHFDAELIFRDARLQALGLIGSFVPGLAGDRVDCAGGMFLRDGFVARGEVRLRGAHIGGDLDGTNARFEGLGGTALALDGATVGGNIFLRGGLVARGSVLLPGIECRRDLSCEGGRFEAPGSGALVCDRSRIGGDVLLRHGLVARGTVRLLGADIGGNLHCMGACFEAPSGIALSVDGVTIGGAVFMRKLRTVRGRVEFSSASAATLLDDAGCWVGPNAAPSDCALTLDGFTYQRVGGTGPTDAATRITWLKRQRPDHLTTDFRPQPWEQLIKVLREMGHPEDARRVAIEKQRMILHNDLRRLLVNAPQWRSPFFAAKLLLIWLYGLFTGFGYRPLRTVGAMVGVWLVGALLFASAARQGIMVPTDVDILLHRPEAENSRPLRETCAGNWTRCAGLPREYPAFQPLVYSLELILPVVDLQQARKWTPRVDQPGPARLRDDFPRFVRAFMWFEILFGWAGTLLLTAVLSGLAKKD